MIVTALSARQISSWADKLDLDALILALIRAEVLVGPVVVALKVQIIHDFGALLLKLWRVETYPAGCW